MPRRARVLPPLPVRRLGGPGPVRALRRAPGRRRVPVALLLAASLLGGPVDGAAAAQDPTRPATAAVSDPGRADWVWPLAGFRIARPYAAPAHPYGPGHRGIDLASDTAPVVRAPAAGVVAFSGTVAGRGILTIDHGDGLVTTLEPVTSGLQPGTEVARGEELGTISRGGHAEAGTVHFGVRFEGEYVNPLLLLGGVPHAVLLPCCS